MMRSRIMLEGAIWQNFLLFLYIDAFTHHIFAIRQGSLPWFLAICRKITISRF
jgi:hypothetical protein